MYINIPGHMNKIAVTLIYGKNPSKSFFSGTVDRFQRNLALSIDGLRVNITIVYEHIVCATSAFSMCMLRVVFNVILF